MAKRKTRSLNIPAKYPDRADRMILGDGCIFSTDCRKTGLNNNILVVGGSGSGKTVSIVEPFLLESFSRSIVCSVTKRGIVNKFIPLLQNRGYKILDLDFVHPSRGNVCFDPLDYINSFADISFLSQSIISGTRRNHNPDPYWDESAASLLNALIAETLMLKDDPTFADVLETIDSLSISSRYDELVTTDLDEKFKFLESKDPLNYASSNWRTFSNLPVKTAGCVFSTLHSIIDSTFTPELRVMFRMRKRLRFEQLANEKTALFITSSPVNPSINSFISLFYAQLFKELFDYAENQPDGKLPVPVHLIADDFATGCPVPLKDILEMPIGSQILFRHGSKPHYGQRYNTFANAEYQNVLREYEKRVAKEFRLRQRVRSGQKANPENDDANRRHTAFLQEIFIRVPSEKSFVGSVSAEEPDLLAQLFEE